MTHHILTLKEVNWAVICCGKMLAAGWSSATADKKMLFLDYLYLLFVYIFKKVQMIGK